MALQPFLTSIVSWLRAGYPDGVPDVDYIPLFALLGTQLSEADAQAIAAELAASSDLATAETIRKAIGTVTHDKPLDMDVARVRARLAAGGWPLAGPDELPS